MILAYLDVGLKSLATCLLAACLAGVAASPAPAQEGAPQSVTPELQAEFKAWLAGVADEAIAKGIRPETIDQALGDVELNKRVLKSSVSQPERRETLADYLAKRITNYRVSQGRRLYAQHKVILADIEAKTGVDAEIIVAIWGVETAFGKITGDDPVIAGLASLGFRSDRKAFFRGELLSALTMLDRGLIDLPRMTGSWAGAMGQPQFIPSSYLSYARDYDGDGIVDIWGNLGDVFFSIASYLQKHGWQRGAAWGTQATVDAAFRASKPGLPDRSNKALACVSPYDRTCRTDTLAFWLAKGIVGPLGGRDGLEMRARIVMPDGADGPAYLAPKNFDVILTYNRSSFYAVSVGVLASLLSGSEAAVQ